MWGNPHAYDYMSYVECRMLPINVMATSCYTELHFSDISTQHKLINLLYSSSVSNIYDLNLQGLSPHKEFHMWQTSCLVGGSMQGHKSIWWVEEVSSIAV